MSTLNLVILFLGAVFVLTGLVITFTVQFYLLKKIGRWNSIKAYLGTIPFFLLLFIKFDNQVKIICRNYPNHLIYFKIGLLITSLGFTFFLINEYLL
jgi:hypothetical protein